MTTLDPLRRALLEKYAVEAEVRRCARDCSYFLSEYWYIPSERAESGREKFGLFPYQLDDLRTLQTKQRVVFGKARQLGITTLVMAQSSWEMLYSRGRYELLVVSKSDNDAQTNLAMMKFGHRFLPEWMKAHPRLPQPIDDSMAVLTMQFPDGREVKATSMVGTPKRGAGKTATRIVLDEHALMDYSAETYQALEPATAAGIAAGAMRGDYRAVFVIISTFRGSRNLFARLFKAAWYTPSLSSWTAVFHPARENRFLTPSGVLWEDMTDDQFTELWRRKRDSEYANDPVKFYSEYPLTPEQALKESGHARFPHLPDPSECGAYPYAGYLTRRNGKVVAVVSEDDKEEFELAPFRFAYAPGEQPTDRHVVIGADPASGSGKDYAVAYAVAIGAAGEREVLAYFFSNSADPVTFAEQLSMMGSLFKGPKQPRGAVIAVERSNDQSGVVISQLTTNLRYSNLFRYTALDRKTVRAAPVVGWPQDRRTKVEAIDALAQVFTVSDLDGHDVVSSRLLGIGPELRDELGSFVVSETKAGNVEMKADGDAHDDHVMSMAIALAVADREDQTKPRSSLTAVAKDEGIPVSIGAFTLNPIGAMLEKARASRERHQVLEARRERDEERTRHVTERLSAQDWTY